MVSGGGRSAVKWYPGWKIRGCMARPTVWVSPPRSSPARTGFTMTLGLIADRLVDQPESRRDLVAAGQLAPTLVQGALVSTAPIYEQGAYPGHCSSARLPPVLS